MAYEINISFEAETDADETVTYYENKLTGLGIRFIIDLQNSLSSLSRNPLSFHKYGAVSFIRRCNLDVFPYAIYFVVEGSKVNVLAIISQHRSKFYIKRRLK